jgi:RNA polymerase sigma-70 factor (ECF subfamily)
MTIPDPQDAQSVLSERSLSDEALMEQVKAQDVHAFSLLFDRYARPVYALAAHLLGASEAEEIVQEVFWRVWHRARQYELTRGSVRVWIMTVARHLALDALKRRSQEERVRAVEEIDTLLANLPASHTNVEEIVWKRQRAEAMEQVIHALPDAQRRVILLAYFGGFSHAELAAHLGWPLGTVKKRVRLALQKLRTYLLHWDEVE